MRMQRLASIREEDATALGPGDVVSALIGQAFPKAGAGDPSGTGLAGVVQTEVAERLMILAVNDQASGEVRAIAMHGVKQIQGLLGGAAQDPVLEHLKTEIAVYLQNPRQNVPKLKPSGAPTGPPV